MRRGELAGLRKLDERKQVVAWWIRKQTTVSNAWVSEALKMGDAGNISKVVRSVQDSRSRSLRRLKKRVQDGG